MVPRAYGRRRTGEVRSPRVWCEEQHSDVVEKLELADLSKGDERTRVRYHHGAHIDSLAAFSAAHSSSVISR